MREIFKIGEMLDRTRECVGVCVRERERDCVSERERKSFDIDCKIQR